MKENKIYNKLYKWTVRMSYMANDIADVFMPYYDSEKKLNGEYLIIDQQISRIIDIYEIEDMRSTLVEYNEKFNMYKTLYEKYKEITDVQKELLEHEELLCKRLKEENELLKNNN